MIILSSLHRERATRLRDKADGVSGDGIVVLTHTPSNDLEVYPNDYYFTQKRMGETVKTVGFKLGEYHRPRGIRKSVA